MRVSVVLGTRPEIIKMSPIIRACQKKGVDFEILHTGQHYSYDMDKTFFEQLELPVPKYNLGIGSGSHAEQTGRILIKIEPILMKEKPDVVLVEGDTNTVISGALAASKLGIKIGHVEAGLRSYDRRMPEEINRVLTDHISDYLFAPTQGAKENLLREGIKEDKILITGNTVVDAVIKNLELAKKNSGVLKSLGLEDGKYILVTAHRAENVDSKEKFAGIINGLKMVHEKYNLPIILPLHPRSQKMLDVFNLDTRELTILPPASYLAFLQLEAHAKAILTDSGGVQEEACILGVPCVTLRENTERPETISVGANRLSGTDSASILNCYDSAIKSEIGWVNPFGDGHSGDLIMKILQARADGGLNCKHTPLGMY